MWRRWSGQRGALGFLSWITGGRPVGKFLLSKHRNQKRDLNQKALNITKQTGQYTEAGSWT